MENAVRDMLHAWPESAFGWRMLSIALQQQGKDAASAVQKAQALSHGNAQSQFEMGNAFTLAGQLDEARASYDRALEIDPGHVGALNELAMILKSQGQSAAAEMAFRRAIMLQPDVKPTLFHYADLLRETGRHEEAIDIYHAALLLAPDDEFSYNNLGMSLQALGKFTEAIEVYQKAQQIAPQNPFPINNIGSIYQAQGDLQAAMRHYRQACAIDPTDPGIHFNIGTCQMELNQADDALKSYELAIKYDPQHRQAHVNIGAALNKIGRLDGVVDKIRSTLTINPDWHELHSNLLFYLSHQPKFNADSLLAEHLLYAQQFEAPLRAGWPQHPHARDPQRRLRIGFVSADLYDHPVTKFLTPVLQQLRHSPLLELIVYDSAKVDDHITAHLRNFVSEWHKITQLSNVALAEKISADSIDILIDLSGHTGDNRLPAFALKPAPLQASWIGYPMTTGLQAIDYYLCDRFSAPPGLLDAQFTEKLVYLPASAPFLAAPNAPPVAPSPASELGYITFGSFNRVSKISREVIACWAKLLRAVPQARMLIGAITDDGIITMLRARFAREGITADRLSFHASTNILSYLALHAKVDICLDTFPYTGGTTTFHALWMGVPTLTMTGPTLPNRVGATIIEHVGLQEFIAQDVDDFIEKGIRIAGNISELANLRSQLRSRVMQSAMGQPALIADGLENALRVMWQRWCADLPPISFTADAHDLPEAKTFAPALGSISVHEGNLDTALLLAIEHHQMGKLILAETLYLAILKADPAQAIANHNMGLLAGQLGFHDAALPYLHAAICASPEVNLFKLSYGKALLESGKTEECLQLAMAHVEEGMDPEGWQDLLTRTKNAIADTDADPTQEEATHVIDLYESGDYAQLEVTARTLVKRYPNSGVAWSALGTALQLQGKDALDTLRRTAQLAPDDAEAHFNLGDALQAVGQFDTAIECYRNALDRVPDFSRAFENMGAALLALDRFDDAAQSYRQALAVHPENAQSHFNLANTLIHQGKLQDAHASYLSALALEPGQAAWYGSLGRVQRDLGLYAEATQSYRRALALSPHHAATYTRMLATLVFQRHYEGMQS